MAAQPANPESVRAGLAERGAQAGAPPHGAQWLGEYGLVLAREPLESAALAELTENIAAVCRWLGHEFGFQKFPLIQVEIAPHGSWVPRALLYPDGRANRLILSDAGIARDLVLHELTHALSNIRDSWGSELLAYHAGFNGAGGLSTRCAEAHRAFELGPDEVLRDGLRSWQLFSPSGAAARKVAYEPAHPYAGFLFDAVYRWLGRERGGAARAGYFAVLGEQPDGDAAGRGFERHFGLSRERALEQVLSALASTPGPSRERGAQGSRALDPAIARARHELPRRWWVDVFELVYLRAAASKRPHASDPAAALYLDYRIYRAQGHAGATNEALRRELLRRTRALGPADASSAAVRYYLLTDHVLSQYGGRMARLPELDAELGRTLRAAAQRLEAHVSEPMARAALGHFHLFYPGELGADHRRGQDLLRAVVDRDPAWEEAYLFLLTSFSERGERASVAEWLDRYAGAVGGIGARLARGMFGGILDTERNQA